MNKRATPFLLLTVLILGAAVWWSQRMRQANSASGESQTKRVLPVDLRELTQVRVRQDYWNSFTLLRRADGTWDLIEPSTESANQEAVLNLLETLANLSSLKTFETPADDSERYREYGLWDPKLTVTLFTSKREHTLLFGREADDPPGVYCAVKGKDEVHITSSDAMQTLSGGLAACRASSTVTNAPAAK